MTDLEEILTSFAKRMDLRDTEGHDFRLDGSRKIDDFRLDASCKILLFVYLTFGVFTYFCFRDQFSGIETEIWVDALYLSVVTLCTVGYGDIVPSTSTTKILIIVLVSVGVLCLDFLLNRFVSRILSLQENFILDRIKTGHRAIRDHLAEDGRIRSGPSLTRNPTSKVFWHRSNNKIGFCVIILCVVIGTLFLHVFERLDWLDSIYLSLISVSTVGYGDKALKTVEGRIFALFWLLLSTIAVASLFVYLAEMRIDRTTVMQSESEFIVSNPREHGKICEDEIMQIVSNFENTREKVPSSGWSRLLPGN